MNSQYVAYAPPSTWGEWVVVAEHLGIVEYTITAEPIGDTVIRCAVRYYVAANDQITSEWREEVSITTGNVAAKVEVRFMGVPTGRVVNGTVTW